MTTTGAFSLNAGGAYFQKRWCLWLILLIQWLWVPRHEGNCAAWHWQRSGNPEIESLVMLGILSRGKPLADRLAVLIGNIRVCCVGALHLHSSR